MSLSTFPWWVPTLGAALFFGAYQTSGKVLFAGQVPTLVTAYALLAATAVMFGVHFATAQNKSIVISPSFAVRELATGLFLALGNYMLIAALSYGRQTDFTALYTPSLLVLGVLAGKLISHEAVSLRQFIAVAVMGGAMVVFVRG